LNGEKKSAIFQADYFIDFIWFSDDAYRLNVKKI